MTVQLGPGWRVWRPMARGGWITHGGVYRHRWHALIAAHLWDFQMPRDSVLRGAVVVLDGEDPA